MVSTNINHRFTEGDIVRHKQTKVIGVIEELTSLQQMNDKRNLLGKDPLWGMTDQPYYKVLWGKDNVNGMLWLHATAPSDTWDKETTIIGEDLLVKPKKTLGVISSYTKVSQLKGLFFYEVVKYNRYDSVGDYTNSMTICITEKATNKEVEYTINNSCTTAEPTKGDVTFGIGLKCNDQVMTDYVYGLYNKEVDKVSGLKG